MVEGEHWERLGDVPRLVDGLPLGTVSAWVAKGRVRRVKLGAESWVCMEDVWAAVAQRSPRFRHAQPGDGREGERLV